MAPKDVNVSVAQACSKSLFGRSGAGRARAGMAVGGRQADSLVCARLAGLPCLVSRGVGEGRGCRQAAVGMEGDVGKA